MFKLGKTRIPHRKNTACMPAVRMPAPSVVTIPMSQHIGAPSLPTVKVGETVTRGQRIAEAAEGLSVPQFASIDGLVTFVDAKKIVIEKR